MNVPNISTDYGPDSGGRVKGLDMVKAIVYGNKARSFGKKRDSDGHTHQWMVYVKPYYDEDLSIYIKKIHFKLHDSYTNPHRIITKPPFEVIETGWGEFEVVIKIHFNDPNERPVTCYHILKLFQSPVVEGESFGDSENSSNALVSEKYEEIIFHEPTHLMRHLLMQSEPATRTPLKHATDFETKKKKALDDISEAKKKVTNEVDEIKEKIKLARDTLIKFTAEVAKVKNINTP